MLNLVQSGASSQENKKKTRNTTTKTMGSISKERQPSVQPPKNNIFPFQTDEVLRESLNMFDTQKTNQ